MGVNMHTITIFGLKGGTGRTTLTMALASALVAKGRRVLLVDATDESAMTRAGALLAWVACQREDGTAKDAVEARVLAADDDLEEVLARAARRGVDIALIDTDGHLNAHHSAAGGAADVVLVPFLGKLEAESVRDRLHHAGDTAPLFGIEVCMESHALRRRQAVDAFGGPVLMTALPRAGLFKRMQTTGRIDRLVADLDGPDPEGTAGAPGYIERDSIRHAWARMQELATELSWLLEGYVLERAEIDRPLGERPNRQERPFLV